ncbi:acyl-CoA/acyl-ACP dehydrogenase [Plantactinospora sp. S1510]|uniref:Acyl-CoA/acyl-ACP dehydrogenase n=1 Tax=Plantactinospora alkalitolerans TaxID=2789879 RepID=A0ABS0GTL9_9ACTN|nr:acyl-CoA dehydrogenase family protein [Plantactinospora alkalitolerans]MBF9129252.1 acyl-CoA/acyl-ACP dehydrogenase [Plantactinospora alkalitolerans]
MPELLDDTLQALDGFCRDVSGDFRELGRLLDRDPDVIGEYLDRPGVRLSRFVAIPPRYWTGPEAPANLVGVLRTVLGQSVAWERLAYGDPNVWLASPGPALSGGVIDVLATPAQADRYYQRLVAEPLHTFFGLTEPAKGSAATELETTLTPADDGDGWILDGEKCYIGNGARAQFGVVFCRRAPGLLGIEAVLLDCATPGFSGELLSTVGLRGARISRMRFDRVRIPAENLLGAHLPATRRGLYGVTQVLYRARPTIAAMALGCAQAVCDYVRSQRRTLAGYDRLHLEDVVDRIAAVRLLIHRSAADVDRGVVNSHRLGAAKARAARLSEEATLLAARLLGPAALVEHPWLEKIYRDVRAFEIMEGTTNLHRMSVFRGVLKNTFLTASEPPGNGHATGH